MDFSLSSSLVGSAVSNPDRLALDLQFAADKTLTARKGPTPQFTRGSSGTYFGPLVTIGGVTLFKTTGISSGRAYWVYASDESDIYSLSYTGSMWELQIQLAAAEYPTYHSAAAGSEWRPDQANWSGSGVSVTTSSTFGIIRSAINEPRFDHDPATLACKGLLIEESRTNLVFPSATLTTQTRTVTAVAHTLSFYGTGTVVLSGVAIATVTGTGDYPTRTTLTFTPTAGSLIMTVTGSVTQAQLEAGSFPTSCIPTTTASVIRSADVCSITGSAFSGFYNQTEGTALVKTIGGDSASSRDLFRFSETIAPIDSIFIAGYSRFSLVEIGVITNNSQQFVYFGNLTRNLERLSLAYAQNSAAYARNGTIEATDTSVTTSNSITQLFLGEGGINGCISSFRYYKKRLSNAKLRAITV